MLPTLQYITDSPSLAYTACKCGVSWIQARIKNKDEDEWLAIAKSIAQHCESFGIYCTINDNVEIALKVNADGVHLGKKDMQISEARKILGDRKMFIGASANTLEDVIFYAEQKVDYMGLGPLRLSSTKKDLNPVLGMDGYKNIMKEVRKLKFKIPPIYAIGGIQMYDVSNLISIGISGVAVSSAISESINMGETIKGFYNAIGKYGIEL